jgi:hypothetical protein
MKSPNTVLGKNRRMKTVLITFKPDSGNTVATWTMTDKKIFITNAIGLFVSMDKMLGSQFEAGLAHLKSIAETSNIAAAHH